MKKKKILVIINGFNTGGIEKTLLQCFPLFRQFEIQVDICCFDKSGPLLEDYETYVENIYEIKKTGSILIDAYQLNKILKKKKYDIIHSRFGFSSGGWCFICWIKKIPIIVSIHNMKSSLFSNKKNLITSIFSYYYTFTHKLLIKFFSTHIIGHSESNLTYYDKNWRIKKKYSVIYNGVNFTNNILTETDSFQFDNKYTYLLHIGSFRTQKNHKFLIEIFENIHKLNSNVKLILLGNGELKNEIIDIVKKKGLNDNVFFLGVKKNVGYYYMNSDLFIFPSIHEGLGNVIIEAQYFEVPVMASDIPPHFEALSSLQHNHLFNLNTSPHVIAQLALDIIDGRKNYLSESKEYVINNFSIDNMVEKLCNLYNSISEMNKKTF